MPVLGHAVADLGLVGEEAREGPPKVRAAAGIVGLIHGVDEKAHRVPVQRIDVPLPARAPPGGLEHHHAPGALGDIGADLALPDPAGQVGHIGQRVRLRPVDPAQRHAQQPLPRLQPHHEAAALHRADRIRTHVGQVFLAPGGIVRDPSVAHTGGKVGVVQHPYPHPAPLCLVHDHVQIRPPLFAQKIRMGAGFHAHRADAALRDAGHALPQQRFAFPVLPEKRKDIVVRAVFQYLCQSVVHSHSRLSARVFILFPFDYRMNVRPLQERNKTDTIQVILHPMASKLLRAVHIVHWQNRRAPFCCLGSRLFCRQSRGCVNRLLL